MMALGVSFRVKNTFIEVHDPDEERLRQQLLRRSASLLELTVNDKDKGSVGGVLHRGCEVGGERRSTRRSRPSKEKRNRYLRWLCDREATATSTVQTS
mmetsp:Transcript_58291/g.163346  ORF Transcript_58291/g.163346 Transcript_58291/m.163346 type:complete len:98 (+) Transcript_58291:81-374(+)